MKPENFIIACDMDDTITDLVTPWIQYLNNKHGTNVNPYKDLHWDMKIQFPNLSYTQIFEPLFEKEFWKNHVTPLPDAPYYVKKLIDEGFQFYIVTSSHYESLTDKFNEVLFKYFPFIDRHKVIVASNKQLIRCNVLIDDGAHNIVGPYMGLLMNAQHNKSFDESQYPDVTRVYNWKEIYENIHRMLEES